MERDFLGMKSEIGSRSQDAAASLSSAVQWPFANKASAMHQFMSYKIAEEERQKKYFVNPGLQAAPTKDVFEARGKKFPTTASQKFTRNIAHQLPIHAYHQSQRSGNLGASACQLNEAKAFPVISHHADPVVMSNPHFKLHGNQSSPNNVVASMKQQAYGGVTTNTQIGGSMTGGLAFSRMPKLMPATAQLTIFYAGSVNVFDDVSLEKAQEIISLASKGSLVLPSSSRSEAAIQAAIPVPMKVAPSDGLITKKTINPAPRSPCSGLSSTKSVSSHKRPNSRSSCSTTDDAAGDKTVSPLAKINHDEPLTTATEALGTANTTGATPRAVPQARKASLARFLERRKYRAISVMPYSCSKKITDTDTKFENGKLSIISPDDGDLSSSPENFWYLGHAKSNITMGEPPSTKLEI